MGATRGLSNPEEEAYAPIADRVERLAARVARWVELSRKPNRDKKIAFILHNNPCASVEATVGGGAHLDTLESVAHILKGMKEAGYLVTPPENGKALIDAILSRKALSEFRWTTTDEIATKGGALVALEKERYLPWFEELPETTRRRMIEAWGEPPGEERNGVPAAMLHEGKLLITGVNFGNAVVCVQPKRGCAGARCDGRVCKILHDPEVPPPTSTWPPTSGFRGSLVPTPSFTSARTAISNFSPARPPASRAAAFPMRASTKCLTSISTMRTILPRAPSPSDAVTARWWITCRQ